MQFTRLASLGVGRTRGTVHTASLVRDGASLRRHRVNLLLSDRYQRPTRLFNHRPLDTLKTSASVRGPCDSFPRLSLFSQQQAYVSRRAGAINPVGGFTKRSLFSSTSRNNKAAASSSDDDDASATPSSSSSSSSSSAAGAASTTSHSSPSSLKASGDLRSSMTKLLQLAKPESKLIGGALACLVVTTSTSLLFPWGMGQIIDTVNVGLDGGGMESLESLCTLLLGAFVVGGVAQFARTSLINVASERIAARLRTRVFHSLLQQETAFFDANRTGELINRLSTDTTMIAKTLTEQLAIGIRRVAESVGGLGILIWLSPPLAATLMAVMPPMVGGAVLYGKWVKRLSREVLDAIGRTTELAEEKISSIKTVRMFAKEEQESSNYEAKVNDVYLLGKKTAVAGGAWWASVHLGANVALLAVLYKGGFEVLQGHMTVGDLTSFLIYSVYVGASLAGSASFFTEMMKGVGASGRVFELMDRTPLVTDGKGTTLDHLAGDLKFSNVSFAYPTRQSSPIFTDFNLHIPAGTVCALVGQSGSGKSTIAQLVSRLYDPDSGSIHLDGTNTLDMNGSWLRKQLGIVSQEPVLFAGTIADNIRYGCGENQEVTQKDIERVARLANADSFVQGFKDKYDTMVGERGQTLSGGQKQRIAIARALLKDPKILILDEATSALDSQSEAQVQEALERLMVGRTTLVIAHRLATIKKANQIAVLQDGVIGEVGSYNDLMEKGAGSMFRTLYDTQLQHKSHED